MTAAPTGSETERRTALTGSYTVDGEPVSWTFQGVGQPTGPNFAARFRGSVFFQTPSAKLGRLNTLCAVVAAETDAQQQLAAKLWEWA